MNYEKSRMSNGWDCLTSGFFVWENVKKFLCNKDAGRNHS